MFNPYDLVRTSTRSLTDFRPTPGETIGSTLGSAFGPWGTLIGATLGRMLDHKLFG